jgi:hypothetical protein
MPVLSPTQEADVVRTEFEACMGKGNSRLYLKNKLKIPKGWYRILTSVLSTSK